MNIYEETKFLMKKYGITANKSLGQNFLVDESVILNAISQAEICKDDLVIEIGPGLGTFTNELIKKAAKVVCVELDKKMVEILEDRFKFFDNIEIINEDILKVDIDKIVDENKDLKVKIVGNLPYYITTPIIMKLLEGRAKFESITVMIQKEVADRLCAKTGTREAGAITYAVEYYANARKLIEVPHTSFIPMPNVESEVIILEVRKEKNIKVKDEDKLFKVIKYAFMQRRKTLINALQNTEVCDDKEKLRDILHKLNIDERVRGEALTLEQFAEIANLI